MENRKLPNASAVLILGILSIVTCCCYGIFGVILGIVALFLAKGDLKLYAQNPENYSNYNNLKIGRILAIIGIILSAIMIVLVIWMISVIGFENFNNEDLVRERLENYFGQ
jgi:heme/copper-type cytochrome/quinol oxidase subunit 2